MIGEKPAGDVLHCFCGWDGLAERIARSGRVVIEPAGVPSLKTSRTGVSRPPGQLTVGTGVAAGLAGRVP